MIVNIGDGKVRPLWHPAKGRPLHLEAAQHETRRQGLSYAETSDASLSNDSISIVRPDIVVSSAAFVGIGQIFRQFLRAVVTDNSVLCYELPDDSRACLELPTSSSGCGSSASSSTKSMELNDLETDNTRYQPCDLRVSGFLEHWLLTFSARLPLSRRYKIMSRFRGAANI